MEGVEVVLGLGYGWGMCVADDTYMYGVHMCMYLYYNEELIFVYVRCDGIQS